VTRLSQRLGLTRESDPVKIEAELQALVPRRSWTFLSHALIWHGRRVCGARRPACERCELRPDCPFPASR
jgi:endonuclease-3